MSSNRVQVILPVRLRKDLFFLRHYRPMSVVMCLMILIISNHIILELRLSERNAILSFKCCLQESRLGIGLGIDLGNAHVALLLQSGGRIRINDCYMDAI